MAKTRLRLDVAVMEKFGMQSRTEAAKAIMAGKVFLKTTCIDKPGTFIASSDDLSLKDYEKAYVGRGGVKLKGALDAFNVNPRGHRCADIGISTGGFTDCLFQEGAAFVAGFDVGYGQVDWSVRTNPSLALYERTNFRALSSEEVSAYGVNASIVVSDVSFISITLLVPNGLLLFDGARRPATDFFHPFDEKCATIPNDPEDFLCDAVGFHPVPDKMRGIWIALIKPQFELEASKLGKGGIVKEAKYRKEAVEKVVQSFAAHSLLPVGLIPSPIEGGKGNREYLLLSVVP